MAKPFDATLKHLLTAYPADWLARLAADLHLHSLGPVEVIDADLATVTSPADQVFHVRGRPPWLLHLELQASRDRGLPHRLLRYNVLLAERHGLPVRSVVLLLRPQADGSELEEIVRLDLPEEPEYLRFRYHIVRLWQRLMESFLHGALGTLPLTPLSAVPAEALPGVIETMQERVHREAAPAEEAMLWTATYVRGCAFHPISRLNSCEECELWKSLRPIRRLWPKGLKKAWSRAGF